MLNILNILNIRKEVEKNMLVNLNDVLKPARKNGYAVGLFNTVNLEMARGVIAAAEETGSPVIIGTAEILLPVGPLENIADMLIPMAKRSKVPVVVHYDHGLTFEKCLKTLRFGFSSIMYDCSTASYDENVERVSEMAKIAHACGATIEGELGHVGNNPYNEGDQPDPSSFFTQPELAKDFVERTGVDALAISVGNAHGAYKLPPKLDFERIEKIAGLIPDTALVLHGGSGLSDDDFHKAIELGISKVNIFTDINVAQVKAIMENCNDTGKGITEMIPCQVEAVKKETIKKMKLFGSVGRY